MIPSPVPVFVSCYPCTLCLFEDDERYINILGNPGSGPLELFWDVFDAMNQNFEGEIEVIKGAVKRYNEKHQPGDGMGVRGGAVAFGIETMVGELFDVVKADEELSDVFSVVRPFPLFLSAFGGLYEQLLKQDTR